MGGKGTATIERHTEIGELTVHARRSLRRILPILAALLLLATGYLAFMGRPGGLAFGLIGLGSFAALAIWCQGGIGLPLMPLVIVQNLLSYGLPILFGHPAVTDSRPEFLAQAGVEVFGHALTIGVAWWIGMALFTPAEPYSLALMEVNRLGLPGLRRFGLGLVAGATAYRVLQGLGLLEPLIGQLPSGTAPILTAVASACSSCGFFLVALGVGSGRMAGGGVLFFWILLAANALIAASGFLLSAAAIDILAVGIGLFWGSGRVPWRYFLVLGALLSFLNVGKFVMRARYWSMDPDRPAPQMNFADLPDHYAEWFQASYQVLTEKPSPSVADWQQDLQSAKDARQSIFDRIDNLQNLLFVINAVKAANIPILNGATYTVIPALFIPRILWPDKPRTHEGQVLLNVHFGRQDLLSTFSTYVAWGLLPEAYGNFGPFAGAIILGAVLGLGFAWVECATARKLVISLEGFVAFSVFLNLANAFEMVASVLVTSIFQSLVPIVLACAPFVRRMRTGRPVSGSP